MTAQYTLGVQSNAIVAELGSTTVGKPGLRFAARLKEGQRMNWGKIKHCGSLLVVVGLLVLSTRPAKASADSPLSGTYQAVRESQAGDQVQVRLQLHLVNRMTRDLHIQRITLWDFAHPPRGGTQACSVALRATSSADTTQEFIIPRAEYELWKRGARPRVVLEITGPTGHLSTEVVRLERISGGKGN
ncbi:MAG: hypothetical protein WBQ74_24195 [Candidatus Sulfotelmatobacter sp.]